MDFNELFKWGVTPKSGERKGERFRVVSVNEHEVNVREWESGRFVESFPHDSYEVWQPPKTIFEDHTIEATWGNLKKAVEQHNLPDDTKILTYSDFGFFGPSKGTDANFDLRIIEGEKGEDETVVVIY